MEVALFWFLGHRSNPKLTDWSPGNLDNHDFWSFGTRRNPHLWIWIYHFGFKNPRTNNIHFGKYSFRKSLIRNKWGIRVPTKTHDPPNIFLDILNMGSKILESWNFATLNIWSNNSLLIIDRLLMVDDSRLMAQDPRLMPQGLRLKAKKIWR